MKTCSEYRTQARESLTGHWNELAVFHVLVMLIVMGVASVFGITFSTVGFIWSLPWAHSVGTGGSLVVSVLFALPLSFAMYGFFLKLVRRESMAEGKIHVLFRNFSDNWSNFVVAAVLVMLVCLLLLLPTLFIGTFIFGLAYGMVPFVIMDDPNIDAVEALRKSRLMMRGHKAEFFLLQLSFIGWILLCTLCPIGTLWLTSYIYTTTAHFYEDVKADYARREEQLA